MTLIDYLGSPTLVIGKVIEEIEKESGLTITDAQSPFFTLLEASASMARDTLVHTRDAVCSLYPAAANNMADLYHHIDDEELVNMFAYPAEGIFSIYINVMNLRDNGYVESSTGSVITTIPKNTEILVGGYTFTILNDITIKMNKSGDVLVTQISNELDIAVNDLGILPSGIVHDNEGVAWVNFITRVKQVKRLELLDTLVMGDTFNISQPLTNQYYYSIIKYANSFTNNKYVELIKKLKEEYINPNVPSVIVRIDTGNIKYIVPGGYINYLNVTGNIVIETYETNGKISLPLSKYIPGDFSLKLGTTGTDSIAATINNMTIHVTSNTDIDGGRNAYTLEEMKKVIINNSSGIIDVPVTSSNISVVGNNYGFETMLSDDIVTGRIFTASKTLPEVDINTIKARADIFVNTVEIDLSNTDVSNIIDNTNYFVIKPFTTFKEINGKVTVLNDGELTSINRMDGNGLSNLLKNIKHYITPFLYVTSQDANYITTRVYDVINLKLNNLRILGLNNNILPKTNISKYAIHRTSGSYEIYLSLNESDSVFTGIDKRHIKCQLKVPLVGGNTYVYFKGEYNSDGYLVIRIESDLFVNDEDQLNIINGTSTMLEKFINLTSVCTVHIYIEDNAYDDSYFKNEVVISKDSKLAVLSKEQVEIVFGTRLEYMWNRLYCAFNNKYYKKYTYNVPLIYTEDVYEVFDNKTTFKVQTVNGQSTVVRNKLHSAGDNVLDSSGNIIYKHRIGDTVLDSNGNPVVDKLGGIMRYVDIVMLEYEYFAANNNLYYDYFDSISRTIFTWLKDTLYLLNRNMLEQTSILFKPFRKSIPVSTTSNGVLYHIPYIIKPKVTLYSTSNIVDTSKLDGYRDIIGNILHTAIDSKTISIPDIEKNILTALNNEFTVVRVSNIDTVKDTSIFTTTDKSNRCTLSKELVYNKAGEMIVRYDIDIAIKKI